MDEDVASLVRTRQVIASGRLLPPTSPNGLAELPYSKRRDRACHELSKGRQLRWPS